MFLLHDLFEVVSVFLLAIALITQFAITFPRQFIHWLEKNADDQDDFTKENINKIRWFLESVPQEFIRHKINQFFLFACISMLFWWVT